MWKLPSAAGRNSRMSVEYFSTDCTNQNRNARAAVVADEGRQEARLYARFISQKRYGARDSANRPPSHGQCNKS